MRGLRRIGVGVVAALAVPSALLVTAFPGSAAAATPDEVYSPDYGAVADFYSYGEVLYTCDSAADGHHVESHYYTSNNASVKTVKNYNGYGTQYCVKTNVANIPESGYIVVKICVVEGTSPISCSGYKKFSAAND